MSRSRALYGTWIKVLGVGTAEVANFASDPLGLQVTIYFLLFFRVFVFFSNLLLLHKKCRYIKCKIEDTMLRQEGMPVGLRV
jgi:hypothetical protein